MRKLLLILLILSSSLAHARWTANSTIIPDNSAMKTGEKISAQLIFTNNFKDFIKDWQKPETPNIIPSEKVTVGEVLSSFIIFSGCIEVNKNCNVITNYILTYPSGKTTKFDNVSQWKESAGEPGVLRLGRGILHNKIEESDEKGTYTLSAEVIDLNGGEKLLLKKNYEVY